MDYEQRAHQVPWLRFIVKIFCLWGLGPCGKSSKWFQISIIKIMFRFLTYLVEALDG